jgi:uncharacterized protein (DUF1015 family)
MAEIKPFQALRFDTAKVQLEDVLTQPYDKITPQMQEAYYARSPHNLVRLELGKAEPSDTPENSVYTRGAAFLRDLRKQGVLKQEAQPCIYAYSQKFQVPAGKQQMERRGVIALGKLHEYSEGVVHRHELTLAKPRSDRMNVLQASKAHTGQIFMLYSDESRAVDHAVWSAVGPSSPTASMTDEYGVVHSIWQIAEQGIIANVQALMADKKLIIADGHHRYETALAYRNQQRDAGKAAAANDWLMMTFVNMESPGLVILPTHRVVFALEKFDVEDFKRRAEQWFEIEERTLGTMGRARQEHVSCVAVADKSYFLFPKATEIDAALAGLPKEQRQLDVLRLHKLLLERALGISEDDILNQRNVNYYRDAMDAIGRVAKGEAQIAFVMQPVTMQQMKDVAFAGQVMPQKSTDFYPKMMSGMTIYALE